MLDREGAIPNDAGTPMTDQAKRRSMNELAPYLQREAGGCGAR